MGALRALSLCGFAATVCGCRALRQEGDAATLACQWGRVSALTSGAGNDTEAAWSPDGSRIAFQTDAAGDLDLAVVDVRSRRREMLVGGPGNACYPAWTPDGKLVYSFGHHPETAMQAAVRESADGYGLRLWGALEGCALTRGYWRDYTPSVTRDGATVYFASTRESVEDGASLWRMPLKPGAAATRVLQLDGASVGAVQPSLSPDGCFLLWAHMEGFRQNWRLCAARATNVLEAVCLTPAEMSAYAPRWSPDGRLIAFTGFRAGDPGWGIYLLEPRSGAMARLDLDKGNSRSPDWSPDGKELVFENNRSGFYKLYRVPVSSRVPPVRGGCPAVERVPARAEARLERRGTEVALVAANGSRVSGAGKGPLVFERPAGLDFGKAPFYVKLTLVVGALPKETQIAAVGRYAEHALGWQVFVREGGLLCFNSRAPDGQYVGVESDEPVAVGQPVTVIGVRDADGALRMSVGGVVQKRRAAGAALAYGPALSVCLGQQWNGGMRLAGRVEAFECGRGTPAGMPRVLRCEELFGEGQP